MCLPGLFTAPKMPPPAPPPRIELNAPPPAPPKADIKQQSEAAPSSTSSDAGTASVIRRKGRKSLTIASVLGTPGFGND